MNSITVYVNADTHEEIRAPKGGRAALEIENTDGAAILISEDTMASTENAREIPADTVRAWSKDGTSGLVPQGSIWLLGTAASPARQRVLVRQS